jgi:hypothetical protein
MYGSPLYLDRILEYTDVPRFESRRARHVEILSDPRDEFFDPLQIIGGPLQYNHDLQLSRGFELLGEYRFI